jgi:hypothetical protein
VASFKSSTYRVWPTSLVIFSCAFAWGCNSGSGDGPQVPDSGISLHRDGGTDGGVDAGAGTGPFKKALTVSCNGGCTPLGYYAFDGTNAYFTNTSVTWRFSPSSGHSAQIPNGELGTEFRQAAAACVVGSKLFILGGGGDGILDLYEDYEYRVQDLTTGVWTVGTSPWAPHNAAVVLANGQCISVGGQLHVHSDYGTPNVESFSASSDAWTDLPMLLVPVTSAVAAFDGTRLLVAGGWCSEEPGCPANPLETFFTNAWVLDMSSPTPSWTAAPAMPTGRIFGFATWYNGRFYILGGSVDDSGQHPPPGIISWALTDPSWRNEGAAPGLQPAALFADGDGLFELQLNQGNIDVYRWQP